MNIERVNHLLFCLGEECGEVQQIVGKSGRFGIYDFNPHINVPNIDLLKLECHDVIAVYEMLLDTLKDDTSFNRDRIAAKKEKVERYMIQAGVKTI